MGKCPSCGCHLEVTDLGNGNFIIRHDGLMSEECKRMQNRIFDLAKSEDKPKSLKEIVDEMEEKSDDNSS